MVGRIARARPLRKLVIFSTFIVILLAISSPLLSALFPMGAPECDSCHTNRQWIRVDIDAPAEVPTQYDFTITVTVTADGGLDSADGISITIDLNLVAGICDLVAETILFISLNFKHAGELHDVASATNAISLHACCCVLETHLHIFITHDIPGQLNVNTDIACTVSIAFPHCNSIFVAASITEVTG